MRRNNKKKVKAILSNPAIKIATAVVAILIVMFVTLNTVLTIREGKLKNSPIVKITATNTYKYVTSNVIKEKQFTVTAKYKNGRSFVLSPDEYTLDRDKINNYGKATPVTITLKENAAIQCVCEITHVRKRVAGWYCGTPNNKDLTVKLYSNGELNFSGTGDLMAFSQIPWKGDDYKITSITFDEGVQITNLNDLFSDLTDLTYVGKIPETVKYMRNTFSGCTSLKECADWSQSEQLEDISYAYADCSELRTASALPVSVRQAEGVFQNCVKLAQAPDMSQPVNLYNINNMYMGCTSLAVVTSLPPSTQNMTSTFEECINLKDMPQIPLSTVSLERAFYNDRSLRNPQSIPASVVYMNETFYGCEQLDGTMTVESSKLEMEDCFLGAVVTSRLDLVGSSKQLKSLALTGNANITVKGKTVGNRSNRTLLEEKTPDENLQMQETQDESTTEEKETIDGTLEGDGE